MNNRLFCNFLLLFLLLTGCASNDKSTPKTTNEKKAELYYIHGSQALVIKDYTAALKNLLKSIEYEDQNSKAHNNLGMAYFFKGNFPKAKEHLEKALSVDPKNSDARNNLGSLYMHLKKYAQAKEQYLTVLKDLTYPLQHRVYYNLALIDLVYNNTDKATKHLLKAVKENDSYCPAFYQLGLISSRKRDYHSSLEYFKQASRGTCVNDPEPHYQVAVSLMELNEDQRALFKFKEIITNFPETPQAIWSRRKLKTINISKIRKQKFEQQQISKPTPAKTLEPVQEEVESIKF